MEKPINEEIDALEAEENEAAIESEEESIVEENPMEDLAREGEDNNFSTEEQPVETPALTSDEEVEESDEVRETAVPAASSLNAPEIEVSFLLGHQRMPLTEIRALVEGKIISLNSTDFKVAITLQGKQVALAQLVLVDGHPSLQVTKVLRDA